MIDKNCGLECSTPNGAAAECQEIAIACYFYADENGCLQAGTKQTICVDGAPVVLIQDQNGDLFPGATPPQVFPEFEIAKICAN